MATWSVGKSKNKPFFPSWFGIPFVLLGLPNLGLPWYHNDNISWHAKATWLFIRKKTLLLINSLLGMRTWSLYVCNVVFRMNPKTTYLWMFLLLYYLVWYQQQVSSFGVIFSYDCLMSMETIKWNWRFFKFGRLPFMKCGVRVTRY